MDVASVSARRKLQGLRDIKQMHTVWVLVFSTFVLCWLLAALGLYLVDQHILTLLLLALAAVSLVACLAFTLECWRSDSALREYTLLENDPAQPE
jgi:apolipoprotein N-acyltransferase